MISEKQDRPAPRTVADLERKYNNKKNFAEAAGIASDAQKSIEELGGRVDAQDEVIMEQGKTINKQGQTLGIDDWDFEIIGDSIGGSLIKAEDYCGFNSGYSFGYYSAEQINGDGGAMISADKIAANNGTYITFIADIMMAENQSISGCSQIVFRNSMVGAMASRIYAGNDDHAIYLEAYNGVIIENLKVKESGTVYTLRDYIKKVMAE